MERPSFLHQMRELLPDRAMTAEQGKEVAERQANRLLHLFGITEPSVDVARIGELPHIHLEVSDSIPASGLSHFTGKQWNIVVRAKDSVSRRRFTLAHEFKHIIDHPYMDVLYPGFAVDRVLKKRIETVCDHFAASFLMPALWVQREWERGIHDALTLARIFKVSEAAMRVRLHVLGLGAGGGGRPPQNPDDVRTYFRIPPGRVDSSPCPFS
ncbi:ImmA/IrrE family metallo-endopeptidase [Streptomyces sviceus]|uniref:ImmA/IrrE family metallo-endopeptidase n=1 Tax=Streptomyces sviceus TaxID=285530 RepID=UPI003325CCCE